MADVKEDFKFTRGEQVTIKDRPFQVLQIDKENGLLVVMDWVHAIQSEAIKKVGP